MTAVQLHFISIQSGCSPLHVTLMTALQMHFILYTKQLFPAIYYFNDSCTVTFYSLYKRAVPRYVLL